MEDNKIKIAHDFHREIMLHRARKIIDALYGLGTEHIGRCNCRMVKDLEPTYDMSKCECTDKTQYDCACNTNKKYYFKRDDVIELIEGWRDSI